MPVAVWPQTPPHDSVKAIELLATITSRQEMFIIAHEIAHLELGHLDGVKSSYKFGNVASEFLKDDFPLFDNTEDEIVADRLALQLCLSTLPADSAKAVVQYLCIMLRYFLWFGTLVRKNIPEESSWAYRYYEFPIYAYEFCPDAPFIFEDTLQKLETRLLPGVNKAFEIFSLIRSKIDLNKLEDA